MGIYTLSRTDELVKLLSVVNPSAECEERAAHVFRNGNIDWRRFIQLTKRHKVIGLVSHNLATCRYYHDIPAQVRRELSLQVELIRMRNRILIDEGDRIIDSVRELGIDIAALKGLALVDSIYPDLGCRYVGDLDLLVCDDAFERVHQVMLSLGYRWETPEKGYPSADEIQHHRLNLQHYYPYVKECANGVRVSVDIHHRLFTNAESQRLDTKRVLSQAIKAPDGHFKRPVLSYEDGLLFLCTHLFAHTRSIHQLLTENAYVLGRFVDIEAYINRLSDRIDLERLVTIAKSEAADLALYFCVEGLKQVFGSEHMDDRMFSHLKSSDCVRIRDSFGDMWIQGSDQAVFGYWRRNILDRLFDDRTLLESYWHIYDFLKQNYSHIAAATRDIA